MNNSIIVNTAHKTLFCLKKHSPEIMMVAGAIGTVATTIIACKATTKVSTILDESKEEIDKIHRVMDDETVGIAEYSEQDAKKDLAIVYIQTGVKFIKLYGPAVALGTLSLTSMFASHNILKKRNVALAAAYATVDRGFKEYRNRVVEKFGDAVDKELKYGIKAKKITETEIDEETGKEKKVKKEVDVIEGVIDGCSQYARFFDEASSNWSKEPEYNLMFLRAQQNYANDLLIAKGHLFLNEVYDMLDIPRTKAGQVVGWVYDPERPNGDNYVDFGIYDIRRETNRDFVNGYERSILLDFNVDGDILSLM